MGTKINGQQIIISEQLDKIIFELKQCELVYDDEILFDLCVYGETVLDFYYEELTDKISDDLIELISELVIELDNSDVDFSLLLDTIKEKLEVAA